MSVPLGVAYYSTSGSILRALCCAAVSVFMDVDHFFDYLLAFNFRDFSFNKIFDHDRWRRVTKIYVVFHSYELLPLVFFLFYSAGLFSWGMAALTGMAVHLCADQFLNRHFHIHPLAYFFTCRALNGFKRDPFFVYRHAGKRLI